ncbi:murein L,D-transpeptidase [compost metagenome]
MVDPFDIDWDSLSPSNIPYSFKQDPGDGNALGKFKFNFPNGSSIYLHDTPNKSAFRKENRAVSHGCVRVADPLKLAQELVQNPRIYDNVRIETGYPPLDSLKMLRYEKKQQEQSESGHQTRWITLDNKWPLFIDYYTCMPSDNGTLRIYNDVYEYDSILLDSLKRFLVKGK